MKHLKLFEQFYRTSESREYTNKERISALNFAIKRGIDALRNEVSIYITGDRINNATDSEVRKLAKDLKERWKNEDASAKLSGKIYAILEELSKNGKLKISVMGDVVPVDLEVKFVSSVLFNRPHRKFPDSEQERSHKDILEFLEGSSRINVEVKGRRVENKWDVLYDGIITNDRKDVLEFKNVDNGIARTLG
jgi:hypothetical protein